MVVCQLSEAESYAGSPMQASAGTSPRHAVQHTTHILDCFHSLALRAAHEGWEQHTQAWEGSSTPGSQAASGSGAPGIELPLNDHLD